MAHKAKSKQPVRFYKRRRIIFVVFVVIGLIMLGVILNYTTLPLRVGFGATLARRYDQAQFDTLRDTQIAAIKTTGIIDQSAPTYSSKFDVCYIDSGTSFGDPDFQACYFRYVDLLPATGTVDDVAQEIARISNRQSIIGEPSSLRSDSDCLELAELSPPFVAGKKITYPYTLSTTYYTNPNMDTSNNGLCGNSISPDRGSSIRIAVPMYDGDFKSHQYRTFKLGDVDNSRPYILIETDDNYYLQNLPCIPFQLLCTSPTIGANPGIW